MTTPSRRRWLAGFALLAGACSSILTAIDGASSAGGAAQAASPAGTSIPPGFSISGSVTGLYPGAGRALTLHVVNHLNSPLTVLSVITSVGSPNPSCPAAYLAVAPFIGHLWLPARGAANTVVSVSLAHSAPNACQGLRFTLLYRGSAAHS